MKILSVSLFIEILPLGRKQIGNISQQEQKVGLNAASSSWQTQTVMCLVNSPHVLNSESSERGLARVLEEMYMCEMQNS